MITRTACFFYSNSNRYNKLLKCAVQSFNVFHPDIQIYILKQKDKNVYQAVDKFSQALDICLNNNITKSIFLGADTITCARLSEFLMYRDDVLATLDYPYQLVTEYFQTPDAETHLNADVMCVNNLSFLHKICEITQKYPTQYWEQGALNQIIYNKINNYSYKIIDGPYEKSNIIYNARAKGNICDNDGSKPWWKYTCQWKVLDNKLMSHDNKNIKVFHYCDGLGTLNDNDFCKIINNWINIGFNEETKRFFKEKCNCEDFFEREFKL